QQRCPTTALRRVNSATPLKLSAPQLQAVPHPRSSPSELGDPIEADIIVPSPGDPRNSSPSELGDPIEASSSAFASIGFVALRRVNSATPLKPRTSPLEDGQRQLFAE